MAVELQSAAQRMTVLSLTATSVFELEYAETGAGGGYIVRSQVLNDLKLNGREALPAALLQQLLPRDAGAAAVPVGCALLPLR